MRNDFFFDVSGLILCTVFSNESILLELSTWRAE